MLIGKPSKKPSLESVRRIKHVLTEVLQLPEEAMITVSQLACMEEDCAPLETVIGLLRPGLPQLQHKVHKAVEDIVPKDLVSVCAKWGFEVKDSALSTRFTLHHTSRS